MTIGLERGETFLERRINRLFLGFADDYSLCKFSVRYGAHIHDEQVLHKYSPLLPPLNVHVSVNAPVRICYFYGHVLLKITGMRTLEQ